MTLGSVFLDHLHFDRLASFLRWNFPLLGQRHVHRPEGSHAAHWSSPGGQVVYSVLNKTNLEASDNSAIWDL